MIRGFTALNREDGLKALCEKGSRPSCFVLWAMARFRLIASAPPVFTACARAPLAGLLLAVPALAATGLIETAHTAYGELPNGFDSLGLSPPIDHHDPVS